MDYFTLSLVAVTDALSSALGHFHGLEDTFFMEECKNVLVSKKKISGKQNRRTDIGENPKCG